MSTAEFEGLKPEELKKLLAAKLGRDVRFVVRPVSRFPVVADNCCNGSCD